MLAFFSRVNILLATIEHFHYFVAFKEMKHKQIQVPGFPFVCSLFDNSIRAHKYLFGSRYQGKVEATHAGGILYIVLQQSLIEFIMLVQQR